MQHVTDADVPPRRRPPGLALLGRRPAALGPVDRAAAAAVAPRRRRPSSIQRRRPVAGGHLARRAGRAAGSDAEPRIPHPGQQRGCRPGRLQLRRHQPGRSPAGRGHGRRRPPLGPAQRPGARRAARGDHLCVLRRPGGGDGGPGHARQPAAGAPDLRSGRSAALAGHGRRSARASACASARRGNCPPCAGPGSRAARTAARWGR